MLLYIISPEGTAVNTFLSSFAPGADQKGFLRFISAKPMPESSTPESAPTSDTPAQLPLFFPPSEPSSEAGKIKICR